MARLLLVVGLLISLAGCASRRSSAPPEISATLSDATPATATIPAEEPLGDVTGEYEPAVASALVFSLPEAQFGPPLDLSRDGRQPMAFVGFDESLAEYFSVRIDDRQRENVDYDRYERRAVSVRSGVRYR